MKDYRFQSVAVIPGIRSEVRLHFTRYLSPGQNVQVTSAQHTAKTPPNNNNNNSNNNDKQKTATYCHPGLSHPRDDFFLSPQLLLL